MLLFERTRDLLHCEFISDIRSTQNIDAARKTVSLIDLTEYSSGELRDMAQYLYGNDCDKMSRDEIIAFLSEPNRKTAV